MQRRHWISVGLVVLVGTALWRAFSPGTHPSAGDAAGTANPQALAAVRTPAADEATTQELLSARARIAELEARVRELEGELQTLRPAVPMASTKTSSRRTWGPEQAIGEPDTLQAGDHPTAWASLEPDGGTEWLVVDFPKEVAVAQVRVRETLGPGAIFMVSAILADGSEKILWHGTEPAAEAPVEMEFNPSIEVRSRRIRVQLDTTKVAGWNEIDAVELVGADGSRQWASGAWASSTYADRGKGLSSGARHPVDGLGGYTLERAEQEATEAVEFQLQLQALKLRSDQDAAHAASDRK